LTEDHGPASTNGSGEPSGALPAMVQAAHDGRTGALHVRAADASDGGRMMLVAGKVVDATFAGEQGRAAVKHLLALPAVTTHFVDGEATATERISESTVALALWALDALANERRPRRNR
jgi:hypothetical protein